MKRWVGVFVFCIAATAHAEPDNFYLGTGRDGAVTLVHLAVLNTTAEIQGSVAVGATTLSISGLRESTLPSPLQFEAGALVMLHQVLLSNFAGTAGDQAPIDVSATNLGAYEFARIESVAGSNITLTAPLVRGFSQPGAQLVRVGEYTNVTIPSGAETACDELSFVDGFPYVRSGGVIVFLANGTVSGSGGMFRCVAQNRVADTMAGANGGMCTQLQLSGTSSFYAGRGGSFSLPWTEDFGLGNALSGGGGGCLQSGGGGGGHYGRGGDGGRSTASVDANPGYGGAAITYPYGRRLMVGSGGGNGHMNVSPFVAYVAGSGGGGVFYARARQWTANVFISMSGMFMGVTDADGAAGGGGGAGGTVLLRSENSVSPATIDCEGGAGAGAQQNALGSGGGGSGGVVLVSSTDAVTKVNAAFIDGGTSNVTSQVGEDGAQGLGIARPPIKALSVPQLDPIILDSARPEISGRNAERSIGFDYQAVIYLDGQILATVPVDNMGRFTFTPADALPSGTHVITARSEDYGMESAPSMGTTLKLNACTDDSPCGSDHCATAINLCVACTTSAHCGGAETGPVCLNDFRCGCATAADCPASAPLCLAQQCRARCAEDDECPAETPVCNAAGVCSECADGKTSACSASAPFCDVGAGKCSECRVNAHCSDVSAGALCIDDEQRCGCSNDGDCALGLRCEATTCVVGCNPSAPRCAQGLVCNAAGACAPKLEATAAASDADEPRFAIRGCASSGGVWWTIIPLLLRRRRALALSLLLVAGTAHAEADNFYLGTGRDGVLTVHVGENAINTVAVLSSSVARGDTAIPTTSWRLAADGPTFTADSLIMLHQLRANLGAGTPGATSFDLSTTNVGVYELARVADVMGMTLHLTRPLIHDFSAPGTQVVRIPEYESVVWQDDGNIACRSMSSTHTGGFAGFLSQGNIPSPTSGRMMFACSGAGHESGPLQSGTNKLTNDCTALTGGNDDYGFIGLGFAVLTSPRGRGNLFGGGGGGGCTTAGGGGGGHVGAGGGGASTAVTSTAGMGGAAIAYPFGRRLLAGSSGGHGHVRTGLTDPHNQGGGPGGGIIFVRALRNSYLGAFILAEGFSLGPVDEDEMPTDLAGGGGGGAGGTIHMRFAESTNGMFNDFSVQGGDGAISSDAPTGSGGGGGGGHIFIAATDSLAANLFLDGGNSTGATAGDAGAAILHSAIKTLSVPQLDPIILSSARPVIAGRNAEPNLGAGYGAVIYLDGQVLGTTTVNNMGRFSFTPDTSLPSGTHVITARSEDYEMVSAPSMGTTLTLTACSDDTPCGGDHCATSINLCVACTTSAHCGGAETGPVCLNDFRCGCATAADCPADAPLCLAQQCRARCAEDDECPAETPVCNAAGVCSECADGKTAACSAGRPFCDVGAGKCSECRVNAHCTNVSAGALCIDNEQRCGCGNDGDCALGMRCEATMCVVGCHPTAPRCAQGLVCNAAGACVPKIEAAAAASDADEPRFALRGCSAGFPFWWVALALFPRHRVKST